MPNVDPTSIPTLGIYEQLGEFYIERKQEMKGIDTLAFVLCNLYSKPGCERRSVALASRIGDILMNGGHTDASLRVYEVCIPNY